MLNVVDRKGDYLMDKEQLFHKISNGTKIIGYWSDYDVEKAYNLALELEEENRIEIEDISKNGTQLVINAKVK